jgi:hypothetical protein
MLRQTYTVLVTLESADGNFPTSEELEDEIAKELEYVAMNGDFNINTNVRVDAVEGNFLSNKIHPFTIPHSCTKESLEAMGKKVSAMIELHNSLN